MDRLKKLVAEFHPRTLVGRTFLAVAVMLVVVVVSIASLAFLQGRIADRHEKLDQFYWQTQYSTMSTLRSLLSARRAHELYLISFGEDYERIRTNRMSSLQQGGALKDLLPQFEDQFLSADWKPLVADYFQLVKELDTFYSRETARVEALTATGGTSVLQLDSVTAADGTVYLLGGRFNPQNDLDERLYATLAKLRKLVIAEREELAQLIERDEQLMRFVYVLILVLTVAIGVAIVVSSRRRLRQQVGGHVQVLDQLARGELVTQEKKHQTELTPILDNSNRLSANLKKASDFALAVGEGDFSHQFQLASDKDTLGRALVQMRDRLQEVAAADQLRNWNNEGLARFGNILRSSSSDLATLADRLITELVGYLDMQLGALYVVEGNKEEGETAVLRVAAVYAYDRKKYLHTTLQPGEGLVGQVYLEGKPLQLGKLPAGYAKIESGLGQVEPRFVAVVPLQANGAVEGIVELAGLNPLQPHHLEFIEKLGESIASELAAVKVAENTRKLLRESQLQAEQMRTQEEEMRQNMEELSATQEEFHRREKEYQQEIDRLKRELQQQNDKG